MLCIRVVLHCSNGTRYLAAKLRSSRRGAASGGRAGQGDSLGLPRGGGPARRGARGPGPRHGRLDHAHDGLPAVRTGTLTEEPKRYCSTQPASSIFEDRIFTELIVDFRLIFKWSLDSHMYALIV